MSTVTIFILGLLLGALIVYFVMRRKGIASSIASHVQNQQNTKQERKEKILELIREKGGVANNDVESALGVADASATNYLQELEHEGKIEQIGERGRFVSYRLKNKS